MMEGVEELSLAAAFERGQAAYHQCQTGAADEVRDETRRELGEKKKKKNPCVSQFACFVQNTRGVP